MTQGNGALAPLKSRLALIQDLEGATAVLSWDQQTYMPPGGAPARAEQLATLSRFAHELLVAPETGRLIEQAAEDTNGAEVNSSEAALVRVARRDYEKAVKLPTELVAELARTR